MLTKPHFVVAYVTGAAWFIGSHLSKSLVQDGWDVVAVDNLATGDSRSLREIIETNHLRFVEADVSVPWSDWLAELDERFRAPQVIFHLASPASPVHYERLALQTLAVNATGTMHAAALANMTGATLLYASTSETYGDPLEHPQRESYWGNVNPVGIRSCYDEAKRFGEAYVTTAARKLGTDGRVVRIFNTYGPRMGAGDGRVIPNFCVRALRGEPLSIYGDGSQTRSFCYIDDLVTGIMECATRPALRGCVINLGNPREHTIAELGAIIARLACVSLRTTNSPLPPDDPTRRRPDIGLARELLNWEPKISLEVGLQRTLAYFRSDSFVA